MTATAVAGYVLYHIHYSGDIWGPFKPGNAWEANVIDFGDLPVALSGQWLDAKIGLLNNSPIFLCALIGVVWMFRDRDRLLLLVLGIYAATACVNALSIDWRFGFCLPSRFMVTALPALLLPLAGAVDRALKNCAPLVFVVMLGIWVGLDGNREVLALSEAGYVGGHLIHRSIDQVYPSGIHFPLLSGEAVRVPWLDLAGLGAVVGLLFTMRMGSRRLRLALLIGSILLVTAIGRVQYVDRLDGVQAPAPTLRRFSSKNEESRVYSGRQKSSFRIGNGSVQEGTTTPQSFLGHSADLQ